MLQESHVYGKIPLAASFHTGLLTFDGIDQTVLAAGRCL
jgi:hypothetical protein